MPPDVALSGLRLPVDPDAALAAISALQGSESLGDLPSRLQAAVPSRRVSFLAGRWCAREALRASAPDAADTAIGIGAFREPLWPAGTTGSISHTAGYALAAAARSGPVRAIGVDIERWLDDEAPELLGADLAAAGELEALAAQTGWADARLLTLLFSAKESIYKCLFPQVRTFFGFEAAHLALVEPTNAAEGRFAARLTAPLGPGLPEGLVLQGRFLCLEDAVVTSLVLG